MTSQQHTRLNEIPRHLYTKGGFALVLSLFITVINGATEPGMWREYSLIGMLPYALFTCALIALSQALYVLFGGKHFLAGSTSLFVLLAVGYGVPLFSRLFFG